MPTCIRLSPHKAVNFPGKYLDVDYIIGIKSSEVDLDKIKEILF